MIVKLREMRVRKTILKNQYNSVAKRDLNPIAVPVSCLICPKDQQFWVQGVSVLTLRMKLGHW